MKFSIQVSIADQRLDLTEDGRVLKRYSVSTAMKGPGNTKNSGQTPIGKHYIRAKIGGGAPENTVFVGRRTTGEIYSQALAEQYPERDWILTRILWLCGMQPGINRLGNVDSMQRYIYIHGTPDCEPMGIPLSHGCIRMRNADIMELFDRIGYGTEVEILL
ncbi:L,D-transpeptidase [Thiomicrorhabdus sp. 6S3-12]|uniref:L,D-transpeptidase n=1 Tax=Thiomicrorhabdus sp. 6S3-12 TaxID=2819681 RepID=UPI001AAD5E61|nr:L,D-transpeptidase [Thiomicrorhabdus sp. 6S3-12]MBO1924946.1 L,D-transpeptidase [Thiomicrorhabdus sp. 6S3-12]